MADFSTHVLGASAFCSIAAVACAKVLALPVEQTLALVAAGTVGGVLPDIDLPQSTPARWLFTALGALAALVWLFAHLDRYGTLQLVGIAALMFALVRWPLAWVFGRFTVHRGALHSLAAAFMCGTLATAFAARVCGAQSRLAWGVGAFAMLGYLLHLTLDELYSVDFTGARIRRSFGTALKPLDLQRLPGSVAVLAVTLLVWFWTPPAHEALAAGKRLQAILVDRAAVQALLLQR